MENSPIPRQKPDSHVTTTIATYDQIAKDYGIIATAEHRAWKQDSMRIFASLLKGRKVLVPGCGTGVDSAYLHTLGLEVTSFDLSSSMIDIACEQYSYLYFSIGDLREIAMQSGVFDGIWASACLYHLTKDEFRAVLGAAKSKLVGGGVLFLNLKIGTGEIYEETPRHGYPGGALAQQLLSGARFYAYYQRDELNEYFGGFRILKERKDINAEKGGAMEFWLTNI